MTDVPAFADIIYEKRERAAYPAKFGQVGPKVGALDAGCGAALPARHIGDKRAREMWRLNKMSTAQQAPELGLANKVAPAAELDVAVKSWTDTLAERSVDTDSETTRGISLAALSTVSCLYDTEESKERRARVQGEA